jgi:hypothetical protein
MDLSLSFCGSEGGDEETDVPLNVCLVRLGVLNIGSDVDGGAVTNVGVTAGSTEICDWDGIDLRKT